MRERTKERCALFVVCLLAVMGVAQPETSITGLQVQLQPPSAPQGPSSTQPPGPALSQPPGPALSQPPSPSSPPTPSPSPGFDNDNPDLMALRILQQGSRNFATLQQNGKLRGWLDSAGEASDPCQGWTGVKCDNATGRVISLELVNLGIETRLPPELAYLSELQIMNLTGNNLGGGIPSNWGQDSTFPSLRVLDLSNNTNLNGALPPSWGTQGSFISLETLRLDRTGVNGQLPLAWGTQGSLPKLAYLNLSSNTLGGTIPGGWATANAFSALITLDLSQNTFSGSVPSQWGVANSEIGDVFVSLQILDLSSNQLTGQLTADWGKGLKAVQKLDLSNNSLTGQLPSGWDDSEHWQNLTFLDLSLNNLSGIVTQSWLNWFARSNLSVILFPGNSDLCKSLPFATWAALSSSPNRQTRLSSSQCLWPPLLNGPAAQPQASPLPPAPAPLTLPSGLRPSLAPQPAPRLAPRPVPGPAVVPVNGGLAYSPAPGPAPTLILAPATAPGPSPSMQPDLIVPISDSQAPSPEAMVGPSPSPDTLETPMPAPAPASEISGPPTPGPQPAPIEALAPMEAPQPAPVPAPGPQEDAVSLAPGQAANDPAQVSARYNMTGPGLYPANETVREALISAMNQTLGGVGSISLVSVTPIETSRRRLLQDTQGIQATYLIDSTLREAPGIVSVLNSTMSNNGFRENLYNQGLINVQPVLDNTNIVTSTPPAEEPAVQAPAPAPAVAPTLAAAPAPAPSTPVVPQSESGKSGLSGGAIGGIVAGIVVVALVVIGLVLCCVRRRRRAAAGRASKGPSQRQIDVEAASGVAPAAIQAGPKGWWNPRSWGAQIPATPTGTMTAASQPKEVAVDAPKDTTLSPRLLPPVTGVIGGEKQGRKSGAVGQSSLGRQEPEGVLQEDGFKHPELAASTAAKPSPPASPELSVNASPSTSVSDHTAMQPEIGNLKGSQGLSSKTAKANRSVTFKESDIVEIIESEHGRRPLSRGRTRPRGGDLLGEEREVLAASGYSRRHMSGQTEVRQSRPRSAEPEKPIRTKPTPTYEGHEIVSSGGGFVKRGKPADREREKAIAKSHSRRQYEPNKAPEARNPQRSLTPPRRQNSSAVPSRPATSGFAAAAAHRQSSGAMPSRQGSTAQNSLGRLASGSGRGGAEMLEELHAQLSGGLSSRLSGGVASRNREIAKEMAAVRTNASQAESRIAAREEPEARLLSPAEQSSSFQRGSSAARAGSSGAGVGGSSSGPQRQKLRSHKRREADLSRLLTLKSFEADPIRREEVNHLVSRTVEKMRSVNRKLQDPSIGSPATVQQRSAVLDKILGFLEEHLPAHSGSDLNRIRNIAQKVDDAYPELIKPLQS